ncbi:MAG: hypothetical protein IAA85_01580 [Firmicutes bacterium]|nr:hypothetical protein [Candidatus Alectryobacillus merdavium]
MFSSSSFKCSFRNIIISSSSYCFDLSFFFIIGSPVSSFCHSYKVTLVTLYLLATVIADDSLDSKSTIAFFLSSSFNIVAFL